MKKFLSVLVAALFALPLFSVEIPDWVAILDSGNGGDSTGVVTVADETIGGKAYKGVTTIKGKVTTKFQYGFAGMMISGDDLAAALKAGKGIKIKISGDGKKYDLRVETNDRPDYCFHLISLTAPKGKVAEYVIPYEKLKQYDWGAKKQFNKNNITAISFQTIGQPIASYELKVISVEIF